jgi:hypothetical protein
MRRVLELGFGFNCIVFLVVNDHSVHGQSF